MINSVINKSGDDANPLNHRLPAEVVTRRARPQKIDKNEDIVQIDLHTAISLKPEKRLAWLLKACKMTAKGESSNSELFNIITTRRFASVPVKVGKRLRDSVNENFVLFSEKQQRYLRSEEWALNIWDKEDAAEPAESDAEDDCEPPSVRDGPRADRLRTRFRGDDDTGEKPNREAIVDALNAVRKAKMTAAPSAQEESGVWVSVPQCNKQERSAHLAEERRKAREREDARKAELERENEAKEKEQQQRARNRQNEEDADSSLQMLEMFTQQRRPSPPRQSSYGNYGRTGKSKRGLSRSRSISVQRSPIREWEPKRRRLTFEEKVQQRLDARDKADTSRTPVSHWRSRG